MKYFARIFFLLISLAACSTEKHIPKLDYNIDDIDFENIEKENSFRKILNTIKLEDLYFSYAEDVDFFSIIDLSKNKIILEEKEKYLENADNEVYLGFYTSIEPQSEFVFIDDREILYYDYFTIVNINDEKRLLITYWKYNPKVNKKFVYIFKGAAVTKKIRLGGE